MPHALLLLALDTCGPSGSVALGRVAEGRLELLGQKELAGRSYAATLIAAVAELLDSARHDIGSLDGIVVVNGPGSFTGVRVGVSAAKGLAQGAEIPVVALSRLEALTHKAGVASAALDAHRGEIYLRLERSGEAPVELLAGLEELAAMPAAPARIAVCDDAAAALLARLWPQIELLRTPPPLASEALVPGAELLAAGRAVDLALLDGHYLRRSDAEIFGNDLAAQAARAEAQRA